MKYLKINQDGGSSLYIEIAGVKLDEIITPDLNFMEVGDKFILELVEMSEEDYKSLPEFDGDW
jgi:putative lipase involved disintegration of autophagic bodies